MKQYLLVIILFSTLFFTGCSDNEDELSGTGSLILEFDNVAGEEDLELNTDYVNGSGEQFSVSTLQYFISNIVLIKSGGEEFVVPQDSSYFLVSEESGASQELKLNNIPAGDYNGVRFVIGVDSLRSTMDISKRTGALDPATNGMYWSWNSGYIFFKMEGLSPAAPAEDGNVFIYHIGGFGGYETPSLNNIKTAEVNMGSAVAKVRTGMSPQIHLKVDVLEVFNGEQELSIAVHPFVMFNETSSLVAGNYANMFHFDHVHN